MDSKYLKLILIFLGTCGQLSGSPVKSDGGSVLWFPNLEPGRESDLIPAYIPPLDDIDLHIQEPKTNLSLVHFYLHTNENPTTADELFIGDSATLRNSHFHENGPLFLLVHGFGANIGGTFPYQTGMELLSLHPLGNVILLDWSELAKNPDYIGAVINSYAVSNHTAEFLQFLLMEGVVTSEKMHLAGFSLGGQVVGVVGKRFQWLTKEVIGRVSSLDPAMPLFDQAIEDNRISPDDASYVDVIHTAMGLLGMVLPRGHIDFYPNGGVRQPGCGIDITGACSHSRAAQFFMESVRTEIPFRSCQCTDWQEYNSGNCACDKTANLGYHAGRTDVGVYFLRTNPESPYAQG